LIGPGDLLRVAIWEPNPNGTSLTADKSGIETTTRVGVDGSIGVPYVGRLHAAGHTPAQIEQDIGSRLEHEAPGAQVTVLVAEDLTNNVIVQGDVAKPGRYPVVPNSSGLLDVLAMAGGPHTPDRQTQVRITRGDVAVTRTLSHLVNTRAMEMDLAPGDRILVQPRLSFIYAFGEVNRPGEQAYDADDISLEHTLARISGLADNHADPAAVFIYRRQPAELTRQVAPGQVAPGQTAPSQTAPLHATTSVIYQLNLRDPNGFFVAQQFPVLPDDLIYVSEAPISEASKVFQLLTGVSGLGAIPRNLGAGY
jgi:polysaccharide export outer membrane protein